MNERIVCVITIYIVSPFFAYPQDCCGSGPGGGGGGGTAPVSAVTGAGDYIYRLKSVRHYAYSARHPGFTLSAETGGITDSGEANIGPRLEYQGFLGAGSPGSFDIYGAATFPFQRAFRFFSNPKAVLIPGFAWVTNTPSG